MINKEAFAKRLEELLKNYEISAASLADKIGIQRSSISHLLSGRNNPSLDFVIKILDNFPQISFDWFVKGIGSINTEVYRNAKNEHAPTLFDNVNDLKPKESITENKSTPSRIEYSEKKLEKIVLLYSDGSFEKYNP